MSVRAADGTVVARLSAAASVPWSRLATAVERARVLAVVRRYRTDATAAWRDPLRADAWEVPILEVWTRAVR